MSKILNLQALDESDGAVEPDMGGRTSWISIWSDCTSSWIILDGQ